MADAENEANAISVEGLSSVRVSDLSDTDKVINYCLENKIDKDIIDEILVRGYTSMEAFVLLDMADIQSPKIPKGQRRLLVHIAEALRQKTCAPTKSHAIAPGQGTPPITHEAPTTLGTSGSLPGLPQTSAVQSTSQATTAAHRGSLTPGLPNIDSMTMPGPHTLGTLPVGTNAPGLPSLGTASLSGPTSLGNLGTSQQATLTAQPLASSQTSQPLCNQTLVNTLIAQQQQLAQMTSTHPSQGQAQGAFVIPTVQPTWNDPQIHLASATGKSVSPYYDICDFVPSSIEEEVLIGGNGDQRIVVKSGPKKPLLENLTLSQWSIANMAILYKLINEGKLHGPSLLDYLSHTTKIYQLVQRFNLPSVLLYDRECRKLQSAMGFRWGTDVQHLHKLDLIPRDKPPSNPAPPNKKPQNPGSGPRHRPAKRDIDICRNFNSKKGCTYPGCKFRHQCILPECNEAHSATVHTGKN